MTALSRQNWPVDPSGKNAFYGNPGIGGPDPAWKAQNLVSYPVPWSGHSVLVHRLVRASLDRVLTEYWGEIGHDQSVISKYGLADVETYNYRANRNNPASLSNHSYGIAVDIAPDLNPNGSHWSDGGHMLPRRLIELFKFEGWRWGGDFGGTKDPMHFEAVFDKHHDEQPVPAPQAITQTIQTTEPPSVITPNLPFPTVPNIAGDLLGLTVRKFILDRTGIPHEIDTFKTDILSRAQALQKQGQALAAEAQALITDINAFTVTPFPQLPDLGNLFPQLAPPAAATPVTPTPTIHKQTGITATVFGGASDRNTDAYDGHVISDTEPGCSLPFHFTGTRPMVCITGPNGHTVTVPLVDVGPWNTNDPYWQTNSRPQAESGTDTHGRHTNLAGIDLTPKTARDLGISGKGKVDWWFANQLPQGDLPMTQPTPPQLPVFLINALANPKTTAAGTVPLLLAIVDVLNMYSTGHWDQTHLMADFGALAVFFGMSQAGDAGK